MSTTIGIGFKCKENDDFTRDFFKLIIKYNYGYLIGVENAELEVKSGLNFLKKNQNWDDVILLQFPKDSNAALAIGIEEELYDFELKKKEPIFFSFLKEISLLFLDNCRNWGVFFLVSGLLTII